MSENANALSMHAAFSGGHTPPSPTSTALGDAELALLRAAVALRDARIRELEQQIAVQEKDEHSVGRPTDNLVDTFAEVATCSTTSSTVPHAAVTIAGVPLEGPQSTADTNVVAGFGADWSGAGLKTRRVAEPFATSMTPATVLGGLRKGSRCLSSAVAPGCTDPPFRMSAPATAVRAPCPIASTSTGPGGPTPVMQAAWSQGSTPRQQTGRSTSTGTFSARTVRLPHETMTQPLQRLAVWQPQEGEGPRPFQQRPVMWPPPDRDGFAQMHQRPATWQPPEGESFGQMQQGISTWQPRDGRPFIPTATPSFGAVVPVAVAPVQGTMASQALGAASPPRPLARRSSSAPFVGMVNRPVSHEPLAQSAATPSVSSGGVAAHGVMAAAHLQSNIVASAGALHPGPLQSTGVPMASQAMHIATSSVAPTLWTHPSVQLGGSISPPAPPLVFSGACPGFAGGAVAKPPVLAHTTETPLEEKEIQPSEPPPWPERLLAPKDPGVGDWSSAKIPPNSKVKMEDVQATAPSFVKADSRPPSPPRQAVAHSRRTAAGDVLLQARMSPRGGKPPVGRGLGGRNGTHPTSQPKARQARRSESPTARSRQPSLQRESSTPADAVEADAVGPGSDGASDGLDATVRNTVGMRLSPRRTPVSRGPRNYRIAGVWR